MVTSENSWDDIQRSSAHRRALQSDIINHFRDSPAGDPLMENLRKQFQDGMNLFIREGNDWLKPQKLAERLANVRQVHSRHEFERRFAYVSPTEVSLYTNFISRKNNTFFSETEIMKSSSRTLLNIFLRFEHQPNR